MNSSIKIDFADNGKGLQPLIRVLLVSSDDPRDKLLSTFFQSLGGESNWLSVRFDGFEGNPKREYISIYPVTSGELEETVNIISQRIEVGVGWKGNPPNNNPCYIS